MEASQLVSQCFSSNPKYSQIKAGLPEDYASIKTIRDLLQINYKLIGAKEQLRQNLIGTMKSGGIKYPGLIGYDEDVIPALDRAILSRHDIFLIGQIGQAKTRLVEVIAKHLLSPIPVIDGSITNDTPMDLPQNDLILLLEGQELSETSPVFHISPESYKNYLG
ncbi:MAG: hypothetical protein EB154_08240 [Nitrosopumilaceae archaeon]|nr:hypothetical protein [Nitrosopumilaceae archaeon]